MGSGRKAIYALVAVLALAGAGLVAARSGFLGHLKSMAAEPAPPSASIAPSIAILPFVESGGAGDNAYLSEGLPQELIASLSRLSQLKVIGRTSSFQVTAPVVNSKATGDRLGVAYLLEGSVVQTGSQLNVSVQLVRAVDGVKLWSESYGRPLEGLFEVESEIAEAVAQQLGVERIGDNTKILQTVTTSMPSNGDVGAYAALLQGDFHATRDTEGDLHKAIAFYEEAIRLDSAYAMAYARLSLAWSTLSPGWLTGSAVAMANARALAAAQTAIRLAPDLSEAHEALANVYFVTAFERPEAGDELRRAVDLAPTDAEPKIRLGEWLAARGQIKEGLAMLREALLVDPLYTEGYLRIGMAQLGQGHYDEAEATARKALELQPSAARLHLMLTDIALVRGQLDVAQAEAHREPEPFWREYALALVAQKQGDPAAADAALSGFIAGHSLDDASQIAALYAARQDPDHMFEWLNRGITERDSGVFWWLLGQPFLLSYKDDPRFGVLCVRLGIDPSGLHS